MRHDRTSIHFTALVVKAIEDISLWGHGVTEKVTTTCLHGTPIKWQFFQHFLNQGIVLYN